MRIEGVYRALYNYAALSDDELSFNEDAILYVLDSSDPEWWSAQEKIPFGKGSQEDGKIGLIPSNYVEEMEPLSIVVAIYDYDARTDEELNIREDEQLEVYTDDDPDWLLVRQNGSVFGLVPSNYVEQAGPSAPQTAQDRLPEIVEDPKLQTAPSKDLGALAAVVDGASAFVDPLAQYAKQVSASASAQPSAGLGGGIGDTIQTWPVMEVDKKKKKKKGSLGAGNGAVFFASHADKVPVQQWQASDVLKFSGNKNHVYIEFGGVNPASFDFKAEKKADAEAILHKLTVLTTAANAGPGSAKGTSSSARPGSASSQPDTASFAASPPAPLPRPQPLSEPARHSVEPPPPLARPSPAAMTKHLVAEPIEKPPPKPPRPETQAVTPQQQRLKNLATALYDFDAQNDDELRVRENDVVAVIDDSDAEWWKCRALDTGELGVVPATYLELVAEGASAYDMATEQEKRILQEREEAEKLHADEDCLRAEVEERHKLDFERQTEEMHRRLREKEKWKRDEERQRQAQRQKEEEEASESRSRHDADMTRAPSAAVSVAALKSPQQSLPSRKAVAPPILPPSRPTVDNAVVKKPAAGSKAQPDRPQKANSASKPLPKDTRTWTDKTGSFRVEAAFLDMTDRKVHLHKLNGVKILVPIEKLSKDDLAFIKNKTGKRYIIPEAEATPPKAVSPPAPALPSENIAAAAIKPTASFSAAPPTAPPSLPRRAPDEPTSSHTTPLATMSAPYHKPSSFAASRSSSNSATQRIREVNRNFDWFDWLNNVAGVDADAALRYSTTLIAEHMDDASFPEMSRQLLKTLSVKDTDIAKIRKAITGVESPTLLAMGSLPAVSEREKIAERRNLELLDKQLAMKIQDSNAQGGRRDAQVTSDERYARELQAMEKAGANRRGRPARPSAAVQAPNTIDASAIADAGFVLSSPTASRKEIAFDDQAWTVKSNTTGSSVASGMTKSASTGSFLGPQSMGPAIRPAYSQSLSGTWTSSDAGGAPGPVLQQPNAAPVQVNLQSILPVPLIATPASNPNPSSFIPTYTPAPRPPQQGNLTMSQVGGFQPASSGIGQLQPTGSASINQIPPMSWTNPSWNVKSNTTGSSVGSTVTKSASTGSFLPPQSMGPAIRPAYSQSSSGAWTSSNAGGARGQVQQQPNAAPVQVNVQSIWPAPHIATPALNPNPSPFIPTYTPAPRPPQQANLTMGQMGGFQSASSGIGQLQPTNTAFINQIPPLNWTNHTLENPFATKPNITPQAVFAPNAAAAIYQQQKAHNLQVQQVQQVHQQQMHQQQMHQQQMHQQQQAFSQMASGGTVGTGIGGPGFSALGVGPAMGGGYYNTSVGAQYVTPPLERRNVN